MIGSLDKRNPATLGIQHFYHTLRKYVYTLNKIRMYYNANKTASAKIYFLIHIPYAGSLIRTDQCGKVSKGKRIFLNENSYRVVCMKLFYSELNTQFT